MAPRIAPVQIDNAPEKTKELLGVVKKKLGGTPNLLTTMAQSPAVLGSYLAFSDALSGASLSAALREQIAMTVAGANACEYCASAHTAIGKGLGVDKDELARNLDADSSDAKTSAALAFARKVVVSRGFVTDSDIRDIRDAGYSDAQIAEIVTTVALNLFTNYFNHVAQTEVDFPRVEVGEPATA